MPVHHLARLGVSLGACALWRARRERQREVPYATMVTPVSVLVAGDPGYQPAPPEPKPEPEPRCLCGAMTAKTGAIVIGALSIAAYCLMGFACFILLNESQYDGQAIFGMVLAVALHVTFSSLLIHGARTASHCLVVSWVAFQGTVTGLGSGGLLIAVAVLTSLQSAGDWRISVTLVLGGGAVLALQWYFFVVGLRLANHLSQRRGTVLQVHRPATSVAPLAHQQPPPPFQPQQPQFQPQQPQFQPQQPQCQPQQPQFQPQQPQFQPQQPQFQPQQPQFQPQQPQFQPQQPQFQPQQPQFQHQQPQFQPQQPQFQPQQPQFQPQQPQFQPQQPQFQPQQRDAPPPYSPSDLTLSTAPASQNGAPQPITKKEGLQ